jgi:hypothetical protein
MQLTIYQTLTDYQMIEHLPLSLKVVRASTLILNGAHQFNQIGTRALCTEADPYAAVLRGVIQIAHDDDVGTAIDPQERIRMVSES